MINILTFIGLIVITALFEFSWIYTAMTKNPLKAATASSVAVIFSGLEVILYVENHYRIIAVCIGAFIGTFIIKKYKWQE